MQNGRGWVKERMSLDIEAPGMLYAYLQQKGYLQPDEVVEIVPLAGGVSNRTVLVQRQADRHGKQRVTQSKGEAWVVKQALEKLRVAVDWFSSPVRIHREAAGLREVARLLPADTVPTLVFEDPIEHLLAMSAVPQPHNNWKTMLLEGTLTLAHVQQFAELLGFLHRASSGEATALAQRFDDRTFFETLRLEPYYAYTATQVPQVAPFLHKLIAATRRRRFALVHGDYSPKNILVYQQRLVLLDYEVIHWGDPAFDLGFSLTHLLSKAHYVTVHRQAFTTAAQHYWQSYRATVGALPWAADLDEWAVRHTLACLLARVAGRSPLEYLSTAARQRQQAVVVALLAESPSTVSDLIQQFVAGISAAERRIM
jgi:5-methylthioribose kinase